MSALTVEQLQQRAQMRIASLEAEIAELRAGLKMLAMLAGPVEAPSAAPAPEEVRPVESRRASPVTATPEKPKVRARGKDRKPHVSLSAADRAKAISEVQAGGTLKTVAERFGISPSGLGSMMQKMRAAKAAPPPAAASVKVQPPTPIRKVEAPLPSRKEINKLYPGITDEIVRQTRGKRGVLFGAQVGREFDRKTLAWVFEFAELVHMQTPRGDHAPAEKLRAECAARRWDMVLDMPKLRDTSAGPVLREIQRRGVPVVTLAQGQSPVAVAFAIKAQLLAPVASIIAGGGSRMIRINGRTDLALVRRAS